MDTIVSESTLNQFYFVMQIFINQYLFATEISEFPSGSFFCELYHSLLAQGPVTIYFVSTTYFVLPDLFRINF